MINMAHTSATISEPSTIRTLRIVVICLFIMTMSSCNCGAAYLQFSRTTDTVLVSGDSVMSTQATYEAAVMPLSGNFGSIYNEWAHGGEDKWLGAGPEGYSYTNNPYNWAMASNVQWTLNTWHHIAYVFSSGDERLYLDGLLVGQRGTPSVISNAAGSLSCLGAIWRDDEKPRPSFIGLLGSLRISTVARYSGDSFTSPKGRLTADQYTNLLYNFDLQPGATSISDLSGNGRNGIFGVGFAGATSPTIVVPEPSSILVLLCGIGGLGGIFKLKRR